MNICLINNIFPPILTGSSIFTLDLATELHKLGHNVIVVTSKTNESNKDFELHQNGFKLYRVDRIKMFKSNLWMNFPDFYITLMPKNIKRIKQILIDNKIDVIHQCNNIFDSVFISAYLSKKMKIPLICSIMTQIQHSNKLLNKVLEIFDRTFVKYFFSRHVTLFIAGDKETERYVNERYNIYDNIKIVPLGVSNIEMFSNVERNYDQCNNRMISLGHVSSVKDRKELIHSLPIIKLKLPNTQLKIVGSLFNKHIESEIIRFDVVESVVFTGKVERENIPEIIKNADLGSMFFSNLPYCKGVGLANVELMASGLPVILDAYDDNFGPDFPFKDGVHFIKLSNRDPRWIAEKTIELYTNSQLRERIGQAGKKFVLEEFSWNKIAPKIVDIYTNILTKNVSNK